MARIDRESELISAGYEKVDTVRSKDEAYKYVDIYEKTENRKVKRRWICMYCHKVYSGNIARVQAHLGGVPGFDIVSCTSDELPDCVKISMAAAAEKKAADRQENKKRKHESGSLASPQGSTGVLRDVRQTSTFGMGNSELNAVGDGGDTDNAAPLEQSMETEVMAGSNANGSQDSEFAKQLEKQLEGDDMNNEDISRTTDHNENLFPFDNPDSNFGLSYSLNPSRGSGSNSSSLADQPPPPNAVSMRVSRTGMPSQRSDLVETQIRYSFMAGPEDARAGSSNSTFPELGMDEPRASVWKMFKDLYFLAERRKEVERETKHLEWTYGRVTTGQRKINEWLKQEGQVRERSLGLVKKLLDPMSTWTTMPLVEIEGLRKEVKELMEQSEEFIALTANTMVEFVNCRLESPFKDHLKAILGCC